MTRRIAFHVPSIPKPGGSKRGFVVTPKGGGKPRAVITEACKGNADWRASVAHEASIAMAGAALLRGPLLLSIVFVMPRPKGHYRTGKRSAELRPDAPHYHDKKPDCTKLLRSTEDAMTGIVWGDDSQVAVQNVSKYYEHEGLGVGARIAVEEVTP
jgi:Holliday junction resolvase RusA-like endonuclease